MASDVCLCNLSKRTTLWLVMIECIMNELKTFVTIFQLGLFHFSCNTTIFFFSCSLVHGTFHYLMEYLAAFLFPCCLLFFFFHFSLFSVLTLFLARLDSTKWLRLLPQKIRRKKRKKEKMVFHHRWLWISSCERKSTSSHNHINHMFETKNLYNSKEIYPLIQIWNQNNKIYSWFEGINFEIACFFFCFYKKERLKSGQPIKIIDLQMILNRWRELMSFFFLFGIEKNRFDKIATSAPMTRRWRLRQLSCATCH